MGRLPGALPAMVAQVCVPSLPVSYRVCVCLAGHRLSPPPQAVCPPSLWALEGWSPSCRLMKPR